MVVKKVPTQVFIAHSEYQGEIYKEDTLQELHDVIKEQSSTEVTDFDFYKAILIKVEIETKITEVHVMTER